MTVDYRDLLGRYIRHVEDEEGIDFLEYREPSISGTVWSDAEWEALQALRRPQP